MSRFAVLLTGAIALAIVARAALIYRGSDPLAFGLALLIGAGLVLGTIELLVRATRAIRLTDELAALPRPATREAVSATSAALRGLLEAKIGGAQGVGIAAPFTPYLLGLLVMIGLLGTFLGLFETLRGAREALGASGDVAALRAGLSAPMTGLSRAFGTSAAGVSASAMLGLGAVFVRRTEATFVNALGRYATGPLAALTLAGRQLAALEALVRQSEALPAAAASLAEATSRLASLETKLLEAQAKSSAEATAATRATASESAAATREGAAASVQAIRAVAAEIRGDLGAAIERAATASAAVIEPLLRQTVDRAGAVAESRLTALGERLDREGAARRSIEEARLVAIDATARRVGEALHEVEDAVASAVGRSAEADAERARVLREAVLEMRRDLGASALDLAVQGSAFGERVAGVAQLIDRVEASASERLDGVATELRSTAQTLAESGAAQAGALRDFIATSTTQAAERDARADARIEALIQASERALLGQGERLSTFEQRLEGSRGASAEALAERLAGFARGLGEELGQTAALVREASDLLRAGGAEMATVAEMFTGAVDRYRDASDRWLGNLGAIEDALARKESGGADGLLGAYLDQTREVFDHSLQFQRELFLELRALKSKTS
ncbi:MAG: hypothetical protein ABI193_15420 [Minicystis sp.]